MTDLALSRTQAKSADRRGGIELVIEWPSELGPPPDIEGSDRRAASGPVIPYVTLLLGAAIVHHGLAVLSIHVMRTYVPRPRNREPGMRVCIGVHLVSSRYADASRSLPGTRFFAELP